MSGANVAAHVLMTDDGILSSGDEFAGIEPINLCISSVVEGNKSFICGPL
jgi:hypothetical protein